MTEQQPPSSDREKYRLSHITSVSEFMNESWLLEGWTPHYRVVKRVLDFLLVIPLIIVAVFTFPFIALAIKIDSRGPVFYLQERVGRDGIMFCVLKYRSMITDAELNGAQFSSEDDERITRVGAFLRTTRFDEVPQVVNILRGEMTMVGPRPERPHVVDEMVAEIPQFALRTIILPGLTGWAQVRGSYASTTTELAEKLEYDLFYMRNASIRMDVRVLLETVIVVLGRKGV